MSTAIVLQTVSISNQLYLWDKSVPEKSYKNMVCANLIRKKKLDTEMCVWHILQNYAGQPKNVSGICLPGFSTFPVQGFSMPGILINFH